MGDKTVKRLEKLEAARAPIGLQDVMPEAARKALLQQFLLARQWSDLSDPVQIHTMLEAARRSLQVFLSCGQYFDSEISAPFEFQLAEIVSLLELVDYYQQLLKELNQWHETIDTERQADLDVIIERTVKKAGKAGKSLTRFVQSKAFERFTKDYRKFLLKEGSGAVEPDALAEPYEVRHVLPVILHEHLANVRAYDTVIGESGEVTDSEILNELYHQTVALLDLLLLFEEVLGASIADFSSVLQDVATLLEKHHRTDFALAILAPSSKLDESVLMLLTEIHSKLEQDWVAESANLPALWGSFGTRTSQRKFADSLLVLR